jgi:hypothetical protein
MPGLDISLIREKTGPVASGFPKEWGIPQNEKAIELGKWAAEIPEETYWSLLRKRHL